MFEGVYWKPEPFVGGDDPQTSLRVLAARERDVVEQHGKVLNMLAAAIVVNGGPIAVPSEVFTKLPARFGIHFHHDAVGRLELHLVNMAGGVIVIEDPAAVPVPDAPAEEKGGGGGTAAGGDGEPNDGKAT